MAFQGKGGQQYSTQALKIAGDARYDAQIAKKTTPAGPTPKIEIPGGTGGTSTPAGGTTPVYTPPKVQYGDNPNHVAPKATIPAAPQNTIPGVMLTTGELKTKDWASSFDDDLVFGETAKTKETTMPGYLDKRNDYLAQDFLKNNSTVTQDQLQSKVTEYLNSKGITGSQEDINNTIGAFSKRIQGLPLHSALDTKMSDLDTNYQSQRDQLLKAGAIEDRYTNFNEVDAEVNNVLKIGGEDRASKGYNGMPTDQDIQDIATKVGVDFDRAKRIMEGFGYETLDMQENYKKEFEQGYNRNVDDLTLQKQRQTDDLNTKLAEFKQNIQWQQQDILRTAQENELAMQKIAALKGYGNTTSFVDGITAVHDEAIRTVSRLETQLQQAQSATEEDKARLLQDYNTSLSRAKEDLAIQTRDINQQAGTTYNTYLQSYSGDQLNIKLKELNSTLMDSKIKLMNDYISKVGTLNSTKNDEIDNMIQYDNYMAGSQKDVYNKLTSNDGEVLQNHSIIDLQELYKQGHISIDMLGELQKSMLLKAQATLASYGTPISADYTKLQKLMTSGSTPAEAIKEVVLQATTRYKKKAKEYLGTSTGTGTGTGPSGASNTFIDMIMSGDIGAGDLDNKNATAAFGTKNMTSVQKKQKIIQAVIAAKGNTPGTWEALYNVYGDTPATKEFIAKSIAKAPTQEKPVTSAVSYVLDEVKLEGTTDTAIKNSIKGLLGTLKPILKGKTVNESWFQQELSKRYKPEVVKILLPLITKLK